MVAENDDPENHDSLIDELVADEQVKAGAGAATQNYEQTGKSEVTSSLDITIDDTDIPVTLT